ncbi:MAG: hypothetical protein IT318_06785 [Anaerolineales bacterium]|nr:hypothetical protein [Anaerolineales bacterium]
MGGLGQAVRHARADLCTLAGLALLAGVFFWPVTLGLGWIPRGGGDLVSFLWPTYSYAAEALRAGRLPLWNHSLYSGAPFAADNQSGLFYPIYLLVFLLRPGLPYQVMEWLVVGHVWLAGAGLFVLVRRLLAEAGQPPARRWAIPAALAAAAAYMFSDVFVTHVGNLNIVAVSAWLPWVFLALHRGLEQRSAGWCAAAGLGFGTAALAGHAQMTLALAAALGLYGLWHLARTPRQAPRLAALLGLVFAVAMGVSAVSVVPAVEMMGYTARARLAYPEAAEYSLPWAGLAGFVSPLIFGRGAAGFWAPWARVGLGYAGAVTLLLAGLAPFRARWGLPRYLLLLSAFGLLVALGANTPVHRLLYLAVPGFASLRVPARFVLLPDFALAVLAGLGLARLPTLPARRVWAWGLGLVAGGLVLAATAWATVPGHQAHTRALGWGTGLAGALLLAGAAAAARRSGRWTPAVLVVLACADLVGHGAWVEVERNDPTRGFQHPGVVAYLREQPGPLRIDNASGAWSPDAAARFGLEDIGGISNPLALSAYQTYLGAVGPRGSPLYNFLNAQFVIADKGQPPGDSAFVPVFAEDPQVDVYLNTLAQPRVRLVQAVEVVTRGEQAFGAIHAPDFDPEGVVVLDATSAAARPPVVLASATAAGERTLFYTAYAPEAYRVVARTPGPSYVVFSEVWYPGWRAWIDGVETPVYRANFAFRAVHVPAAGEHTIVMRFDPAAWKLGLAMTLLTLATLGVWGGARLARRA